MRGTPVVECLRLSNIGLGFVCLSSTGHEDTRATQRHYTLCIRPDRMPWKWQ
jgi:hypothetical protein